MTLKDDGKSKDNPVITAEHARQITGKATGPLTLELYEEAVRKLGECVTIDETKYFSDAASAWETFAKLKKDDRAKNLARRLKLHWAKRCADIALGLRGRRRSSHSVKGGSAPAARGLLRENGFSRKETDGALRLAYGADIPLDKKGFPVPLSGVYEASLGTRLSSQWTHYLSHLASRLRSSDPRVSARSGRASQLQTRIDHFRGVIWWGGRFIIEAEKVLREQGKSAK